MKSEIDKDYTIIKEKISKNEIKKLSLAIFASMLLSAVICLLCLSLTKSGFNVKEFSPTVVCLWIMCSLIFYIPYQYVVYQKKFKYNTNYVIYMYSAIIIPTVLSIVVIAKVNNYALPIILTSLLIATMLDKRFALISNVVTGLLVLFSYLMIQIVNGENEVFIGLMPIIIAMIMGFFIVIFTKENYTRLKIVLLGVVIGLIGSVLSVLGSIMTKINWIDILLAAMWSVCGYFIAILLYVFFEPLMEWIFKMPTNLHLMELSNFNNPLLTELAKRAPGTYNHCLTVGNFAEQCAYAIGENPILAKVCGYYHDIGKIENPPYFAENLDGAHNPHDDLPFETSVNMIIRHTEAGANILKKNGFPEEVINVARTHHGNSRLNYFLYKAQSITEGEVDSNDYRYPNPRPYTKIAGIIMICDICEAAVRATKPKTNELYAKIEEVINDKIRDHQLDDCPLTMDNLNVIKKKLVEVLSGVYHSRISYPDKK